MDATEDELIRCSEEVAEALATGAPVVALESSIIAQGFPRPENRELASAMVAAVRDGGAVPAVTAVADGRIELGGDADLLDRLALQDCAKCGARDLAVRLRDGGLGATTVSATARIAAAVGMRVFATGGIGGVHRPSIDETAPRFDISADLLELSRSAVIVVSSGAKVILDLPATLEALEALGVPVLGYRCEEFPAFFTAVSGLSVNHRIEEIAQAAAIARDHWRLGGAGLLLCNPPPTDEALPAEQVKAWVETALRSAERDGIAGAAITPYLLQCVRDLSEGRSLSVNRALALSNARLGADLAKALSAA